MPDLAVNLPERMNAAALLVDANVDAGRGGKAAVVDAATGASFTYRQILEMTNRAGNALRELGVRMEERVFLLLPGSPEFVAGFFGAIKIGAVPIPGNTLLRPHVVLKAGRDGTGALAAEFQAFVKDRLGAVNAPRWIEFATELPKTATGKTQRYKLR